MQVWTAERDAMAPHSQILAVLGLLLASGPLLAEGRCADETVCIEVRQRDNGVDLLGRNLAEFPVTLSLSTRLRRLDADPSRRLARTLEPGEKVLLMRLRSRKVSADWHYRYWFDWSPGRLGAIHDDTYLYRLPYASGESFRVLQGFGSRFSHTGRNRYAVDFKMPVGTAVHAARPGKVVRIEERHNKGCWEDGCGKYANYVVVLHDDGTTGEYYHLKQWGALVEEGEHIVAGQLIGLSGNTGHTTMPHLHFAVYRTEPWGQFESLPFRFSARDGIISAPRHGDRYTAE